MSKPKVPYDFYPASIFPPASNATKQAAYNIYLQLVDLKPELATILPIDTSRHGVARSRPIKATSIPSFPLDRQANELGEYITLANRYLLDTSTKPTGWKNRCPDAGPDLFRYKPSPEHRSVYQVPPKLVEAAVDGMIWMRKQEKLEDGKLRTAILCGQEFLAAHGYTCSANLVWVYVCLDKIEKSHEAYPDYKKDRHYESYKKAADPQMWFHRYRDLLVSRIAGKCKYIGDYSDSDEVKGEYIDELRGNVKELPVWTELLFAAIECFKMRQSPSPKGRGRTRRRWRNMPEWWRKEEELYEKARDVRLWEVMWEKRVWRWLKIWYRGFWEAVVLQRGSNEVLVFYRPSKL
ncbi:hypothetical protein BJ508DRAFT_323114 [Ascobolus immersus RN42]|uniref:Uncharacterized protein n=1 Tax=Ascobolus immersus RN42 TaxID=1160509 RepID=A0A3N4IL71_ASCIM|nr:hypothetical protein BJ508DRAFT_323114 [Ascobolus immersus RN42]